MFSDFSELNENVLYVCETLKYCEQAFKTKLDELSQQHNKFVFDKVKARVHLAIKICSKSLQTASADQIKLEIFSHLLNRHFKNPTIVQSPTLSFDLVTHLIIDNHFKDLPEVLDRFDETATRDFYSKLNQSLTTDFFDQKSNLFVCLDIILFTKNHTSIKSEKYSSEFYNRLELDLFNLIQTSSKNVQFTANDINNYLSCIFTSYFKQIGIYEPSQFTTNEDEKRFKQTFYEVSSMKSLDKSINLASLLTDEFSLTDLIKFNDLRSSLYFLSFLIHESEFEAGSTVHSGEQLERFKNYLKYITEAEYKISVDVHFIIRHRLFGFRRFLTSFAFNYSQTGFSRVELDDLNAVKNELKDSNSVYSILKILDFLMQSGSNGDLRSDTELLFWFLFEELSMGDKLDLVHNVYSKRELTLSESSLSCLYENQSFNNEFTIVINQLSAKNFDDLKFLNRLAKLACISPGIVINKLVLNAVSNKNQTQSIFKILCSFASLARLSLRPEHGCFFTSALKSNFKYITENRNEKMQQNYEAFLALVTKPWRRSAEDKVSREPLINASEFFSSVLRPYFESKTTDNQSLLYCFEIYESILKSTEPCVVDLVYLLETLDKTSLQKCSTTLLKLKEKSIILIKLVAKSLKSSGLTLRESDWLEIKIKRLFWPYASLAAELTKTICLPSNLKPFFEASSDTIQLNFFTCTESCILENILEFAAVQTFPCNELLKINLSHLKHDQVLSNILNVVSKNRTNLELNSIFQFIHELVANNLINVDCDAALMEFVKSKNENMTNYAKYLSILADVVLVMSTNRDVTFILNNLIQNHKEFLNDLKDEERSTHYSLINMFFTSKLILLGQSGHAQDLCGFEVEILNRLTSLLAKSETKVRQALLGINELVQVNKRMVVQFEPELKSYKYLITQNIDTLCRN